MRPLLVKSSIVAIIALFVGSGLTLASASSKPGMFLYPLKQTTQKITSAFTSGPNNATPVIIVTQDTASEEPELTSDDPSGDNEDNAARQISFPTPAQVHRPILTVTSSAKGPVATQASPAEEATAAAPPTPAHAVDVINLITQPGHDLESDVGAADNGQSSGTTPTDAPMDNSVNHDESQDDTASDHSLSSAPDSHVDDSQSKDSADRDQPAGSPDANSGDHQDETYTDSNSHHESQDNSNHDD